MDYTVGQRVRHSAYVLQRKRDYWNCCGREPMKSAAKKDLDRATAEFGTVTAILSGDPARGVSPGLRVQWDGGSVTECLRSMVAPG